MKSKGLFVILAVLPLSSTQTTIPPSLEVSISVYDHAHVSSKTLAKAEQEAHRVFQQAGIETVWITCLPKPEKIEPTNGCSLVDATHLMLNIIPRGLSARDRNRNGELGTALLSEKGANYYAYAFLDHVQMLERSLGFPLLGYVLAHEIGHLLLGRNSHSVSGIMSTHWYDRELRHAQEFMYFLPNQSQLMREHLRSH